MKGLGGRFHLDVQATKLARIDVDLGSIGQKTRVGKLDFVRTGRQFHASSAKIVQLAIDRKRRARLFPFEHQLARLPAHLHRIFFHHHIRIPGLALAEIAVQAGGAIALALQGQFVRTSLDRKSDVDRRLTDHGAVEKNLGAEHRRLDANMG